MAEPASYRPRDVPDEPGVYRFFNEENQVIYVGKARSLKNRLNSYFQKSVGEKTHRMIHAASRVDWTVVRSEVEALQLEFTWIKEENPAFNVQFKDDKSYPYLAITTDEEFPGFSSPENQSARVWHISGHLPMRGLCAPPLMFY